jgi:hypothetical protein
MTAPVRRWSAKTTIAATYASTGVVLLALALLVAFLLKPPLLGWVGFAVHLVVPVRVSHLHYLTNDEREESRHAEDRARLAIELLRERGVSVTGGVGSDDPLESMTDALGSFPATRVVLATSTEEDSYWMEHGLVAKARSLTPLQVDHVVVPPTPSTDRGPVAYSTMRRVSAELASKPQRRLEGVAEPLFGGKGRSLVGCGNDERPLAGLFSSARLKFSGEIVSNDAARRRAASRVPQMCPESVRVFF